jgi:hypothetical protein
VGVGLIGGPGRGVGVLVGTVWRRGSIPGAAHIPGLDESSQTAKPAASSKPKRHLFTIPSRKHVRQDLPRNSLTENDLELPVNKEIGFEHRLTIDQRTRFR